MEGVHGTEIEFRPDFGGAFTYSGIDARNLNVAGAKKLRKLFSTALSPDLNGPTSDSIRVKSLTMMAVPADRSDVRWACARPRLADFLLRR
jgi:hypothetical protein